MLYPRPDGGHLVEAAACLHDQNLRIAHPCREVATRLSPNPETPFNQSLTKKWPMGAYIAATVFPAL